jgi:ribonuclease P protein subunit POP4
MADPKILRHELIGLDCEVIKARNKDSIGISGTIEDETQKTFVISGRRVFKSGSLLAITFEGRKYEVEGDFLLSRPEDRIKKKTRKW